MSNITLTIPNDDTIALRQFGKALIEIASEKDGHPVDVTITPLVIRTDVNAVESGINPEITDAYMQGCRDTEERLNAATGELMQAAPHMLDELRFEGEELHGKRKEPEVDTTTQQVESLAVPMGDNEEQVPPTADSTGTPWDERIHSTSKALNADGTWRLRRKPKDMDETEWAALIESVKGELNDTQLSDSEFVVDPYDTYEEGELPQVVIVEPHVTPPGDDFHTDAGVVSEQTVAGIPPLPVPQLGGSGSRSSQSTPCKLVGSGDDLSSGSGTCIPPLPVPPPVVVAPPVTEWDFPRLMTFLTERHGKIDVATVNTLLAQDGMSSVQELNAHPDKIGPFVARVKAHLGERA